MLLKTLPHWSKGYEDNLQKKERIIHESSSILRPCQDSILIWDTSLDSSWSWIQLTQKKTWGLLNWSSLTIKLVLLHIWRLVDIQFSWPFASLTLACENTRALAANTGICTYAWGISSGTLTFENEKTCKWRKGEQQRNLLELPRNYRNWPSCNQGESKAVVGSKQESGVVKFIQEQCSTVIWNNQSGEMQKHLIMNQQRCLLEVHCIFRHLP